MTDAKFTPTQRSKQGLAATLLTLLIGVSTVLLLFLVLAPIFHEWTNSAVTRAVGATFSTMPGETRWFGYLIFALGIVMLSLALRGLGKANEIYHGPFRWLGSLAILPGVFVVVGYAAAALAIMFANGDASLTGIENPSAKSFLQVAWYNLLAPLLGDLQSAFAIDLNPLVMADQNLVTKCYVYLLRLASTAAIVVALVSIFRAKPLSQLAH